MLVHTTHPPWVANYDDDNNSNNDNSNNNNIAVTAAAAAHISICSIRAAHPLQHRRLYYRCRRERVQGTAAAAATVVVPGNGWCASAVCSRDYGGKALSACIQCAGKAVPDRTHAAASRAFSIRSVDIRGGDRRRRVSTSGVCVVLNLNTYTLYICNVII